MMRRRSFIKNLGSLTATGTFYLNGLNIRALEPSLMLKPFSCDQINDRILVLIQLHGGNDGLNTLIPLDQYDRYKTLRPIIGILDKGNRQYLELEKFLPDNQQIGLHPDMQGIKELYDEGYVSFIQNVSYSNTNGSHFRGSDIWLSGKDGNDKAKVADSGWFGRYLDHWYPNYPDAFPNTAMPDPPGLEFGSHIVSLGFHRKAGIPMGLTMSNDPDKFFTELSQVGGLLPEDIPQSEYGDEIRFIKEVEKSTNVYAERLAQVFNNGINDQSIDYPETYHTPSESFYDNLLSPQLRTVARLISGGCSTKVYLVRLSGFDTHANQAIAGKPSFGGHGALLYHLSESVKAFQNDLKAQGLDDRVVTVTFSEFGRQVAENGDWGTDHGTTAPMIVLGKGINGGVIGANPNLNNLKFNRLQGFEFDYRQVFASLLQDWLGANNGSLNEVEFIEFANQKIDLINSNYQDDQGNAINFLADTSCDSTPNVEPPAPTSSQKKLNRLKLKIYPNPASDYINVEMDAEVAKKILLTISDLQGRIVIRENRNLLAGNRLGINLGKLSSGNYILSIRSNGGKEALSGSERIIVKTIMLLAE